MNGFLFACAVSAQIILFLCTSPLYAQSSDSSIRNLVASGSIKEKDYATISKQLGNRFPQMLSAILNPVPVRIIKTVHYNEGIEISSKPRRSKTHHLSQAKRKRIQKAYKEKVRSGQLGEKLKRDIPTCSESKIDSKPRHTKSGSYDVLYVRANSLSTEEKIELSGTEIREFEAGSNATESLTALDQKVACLPFRIRLTQNHIERLYGQAALTPEVSKRELP